MGSARSFAAIRPRPPKVTAAAPRLMWFATPDSRTNDASPGLTQEAAAYAAMRMGGVRFDMRSGDIWTGSAYVYTTADTRVAAFRAQGLQVMGILSPRAYSDLTTGGGRTTFGDDCFNIVSHFKGLVDIWEVTNEPNLATQGVTPANYVSTANVVCPMIRAANPSATILLGGISGAVQTDGGGHYGSAGYIQSIYDGVDWQLFDGVSGHPYCEGFTWLGHTGDAWHAQAITYAILAIVDAEAPTHQYWITECGTNDLDDTQAEASLLYSQLVTDLSARRNVANCIAAYTYNNFDTEDAEQLLYGCVTVAGVKKVQYHQITEFGTLFDTTSPVWEITQGTGSQTFPAWRYFASAKGDFRRLKMAFSLANTPPTGVSISRDGVITVDTSATTPQLSTQIAVRGTSLIDGRSTAVRVAMTIFHPNLITNGDFQTAGATTGWEAIPSNATVSYDAGQGALLCDITGAGGGYRLTAGVTVTTALHQRGILIKKGTYGGTLLNVFVDNLATTPATLTITDDYAWHWFDYTTLDTSAPVSAARNGSFTGTVYVRREILRLKL